MKHVLLVDDVSTNLKYVCLILKDKYKVTTVRSGKEALAFLKSETPDLILLDICMQEMDGYEVMRQLKKTPETAEIPVIILTADAEEDSRERGLALGAVDFIRKPVEPRVLLNRVGAIWKMEG